MKKIVIFLFSAMIFLSSCGNTGVTESDQQDTASNSAVSEIVSESKEESDTEISEAVSQEEPSDSDYDLNAMGGGTTQWDYNTNYTNIDGELIRYVGSDAFQSWVGEGYNPDVNLQTFIQQFGITKEEFLQVTERMPDYIRLSAEEIDALYSGDQAEINRAFASPYAAVSESGEIYTIIWLAEHDEADYAAAGLTAEAVGKAVEACAELGFVDSYVASVETALASMEDVADTNTSSQAKVYDADVDLSAIGGAGIHWDYCFKYYSIPGDLITYIGDAEFDAWVQDKSTAPHTMQSCIENFGLTLDDVLQALNPPETTEYAEYLTISDVEILCSGNQAAINKNFVSPYAAVSESGDIYTIFWLAEHDEADYAAAGLTMETVGKAVDACVELGGLDSYVASAETALASMEDAGTE